MTKLPFCLQPSKISDNNDYESYKKGEFELEEWEDVNYCEHSFSYGDKGLTDREVVDLLNEQHEKLNVKQEHITHLENKIQRMRKEINKLKELYHYRSADIKRENQQLKEEIKDLNDVLARYEEKELIE